MNGFKIRSNKIIVGIALGKARCNKGGAPPRCCRCAISQSACCCSQEFQSHSSFFRVLLTSRADGRKKNHGIHGARIILGKAFNLRTRLENTHDKKSPLLVVGVFLLFFLNEKDNYFVEHLLHLSSSRLEFLSSTSLTTGLLYYLLTQLT